MSFQVGDQVVLPIHGVGQIARLEEKKFLDRPLCWYYEVATAKSTIWVAVDTHAQSGLRPVSGNKTLAECRRILSSAPVELNGDHNRRRAEIAQRLRSGDLQIICEVVRDLTALGRRRPLAEADAALLRQARENLGEEWAIAKDQSVPDALQEVDRLLQLSREES